MQEQFLYTLSLVRRSFSLSSWRYTCISRSRAFHPAHQPNTRGHILNMMTWSENHTSIVYKSLPQSTFLLSLSSLASLLLFPHFSLAA